MKYSVRFAGLTACDESLRQASGRQGRAISQLDQVIRQLGSMSGFSKITGSLRSQKQTMETERLKLLAMAETIRRVRSIYIEAENRTVERADCPNFLPRHMLFPPAAVTRPPEGTRTINEPVGASDSGAFLGLRTQTTPDGALFLEFEEMNALLRAAGLRIELSEE